MRPTTLLVALVLAYLSGPSTFLVLWLSYKRSGEVSLRSLAFCMLGLFFLMAGNTASFTLGSMARLDDPRTEFLILVEVYSSALMMSAFLLLFAHEASRTELAFSMKALFWAVSAIFLFIALSLALFGGGPGRFDLGRGYRTVSVYATISQAYAVWVILRHRERLPSFYRGYLPIFNVATLTVSLVFAVNDFAHFSALPRGGDLPCSPFMFFLINTAVVVGCARELTKPAAHPQATADGAMSDFGLSEREGEILPLIVEGLSNEEIAQRLYISPHTVKNHVTSIFKKAGVSSRFELLKRSASAGD